MKRDRCLRVSSYFLYSGQRYLGLPRAAVPYSIAGVGLSVMQATQCVQFLPLTGFQSTREPVCSGQTRAQVPQPIHLSVA